MLILFAAALLLIPVSFIVYVALYALPFAFRGAPYAASSDDKTRQIIKLLAPKKGDKIVDLGSGDGKLLFEIAKKGAFAYGYEINPLLVLRTKRTARRLGLDSKVKVETADFFKKDLSGFDAVVVYGITYLMPRLEKKLLKELAPGTRVVSNHFTFPNLKLTRREGEIILYRV